ncbi:MAG TPA: transcription antitermination factor NusB [Nitriliruptorales bacterium]
MPDPVPDEPPTRAQTFDPRMARRRALELLFEADVRGEAVATTLRRLGRSSDAEAIDPFGRQLVEGVEAHREALDRLLGDYAHRWSVKRMPKVDRNVLRMAVYELIHLDTPDAVVIDEAVKLAKLFAGGRAPTFINGVLEAIRRDHTAKGT